MALTYQAIASVTVSANGTTSIEFTNIPQTYTDLLILCSLRHDTGALDALIRFNGSTTNYNDWWLYGDGTSAGSTTNTAIYTEANRSSYVANSFANAMIYIPNYTASKLKMVSIESVTASDESQSLQIFNTGSWNNTAAITSITHIPSAATFAQYSTSTLYGIKKD